MNKMNDSKNKIIVYAFVFILFLTSASFVSRQQTSNPPPTDEEEEFIEPSRPTVANSAEFQKPGVLQFEYGMTEIFARKSFARSKPRR